MGDVVLIIDQRIRKTRKEARRLAAENRYLFCMAIWAAMTAYRQGVMPYDDMVDHVARLAARAKRHRKEIAAINARYPDVVEPEDEL